MPLQDNQEIANSSLSTLPNFRSTSKQLTDLSQMQVIALGVHEAGEAVLVDAVNPLPVAIYSGLVPEIYDEITLSYTGDNLTGVVYEVNGATVATLTLAYTGANLTSVVRS